jgi:hypothetical protein
MESSISYGDVFTCEYGPRAGLTVVGVVGRVYMTDEEYAAYQAHGLLVTTATPDVPVIDLEDDQDPDPDMLVERLRDIGHLYVERGGLTAEQVADAVECFDLLDNWLSASYPWPAVWKLAGTRPAPSAEPPARPEEVVNTTLL